MPNNPSFLFTAVAFTLIFVVRSASGHLVKAGIVYLENLDASDTVAPSESVKSQPETPFLEGIGGKNKFADDNKLLLLDDQPFGPLPGDNTAGGVNRLNVFAPFSDLSSEFSISVELGFEGKFGKETLGGYPFHLEWKWGDSGKPSMFLTKENSLTEASVGTGRSLTGPRVCFNLSVTGSRGYSRPTEGKTSLKADAAARAYIEVVSQTGPLPFTATLRQEANIGANASIGGETSVNIRGESKNSVCFGIGYGANASAGVSVDSSVGTVKSPEKTDEHLRLH